jgi:hypothetical protein
MAVRYDPQALATLFHSQSCCFLLMKTPRENYTVKQGFMYSNHLRSKRIQHKFQDATLQINKKKTNTLRGP